MTKLSSNNPRLLVRPNSQNINFLRDRTRRYAPTAVRIGLETGPLSAWLWTVLRAEALPMVCLDARHAKKFNMKVSKTDVAYPLCEAEDKGR